MKAIEYSIKNDDGTNYTIKTRIDDEDYIYAKIFVPLPCYDDHKPVLKDILYRH